MLSQIVTFYQPRGYRKVDAMTNFLMVEEETEAHGGHVTFPLRDTWQYA